MSWFSLHLIGWRILQPWYHLRGKFDNLLEIPINDEVVMAKIMHAGGRH